MTDPRLTFLKKHKRTDMGEKLKSGETDEALYAATRKAIDAMLNSIAEEKESGDS